jgi:hypothetical protein
MMAKIAQYFATGKLTPSNAGYEAYEQAGRRIGPLADQAATGERQLGQDIARLWDTTGRIAGSQYEHGGGGGGGGRGSVETPISFGKPFGESRTPYTNPQQYNVFDAAAHTEISRAAPALVKAATDATTAISPPPTSDVYGPTVLRGGQAPQQVNAQDIPGTVTVLRGGQGPQTVNQPDMLAPGTVTVLRGGMAPQQVQSWPGVSHQVTLPLGMEGSPSLGPKVIQTAPAADQTAASTDPDVLARRAANAAALNTGKTESSAPISGAKATGSPAGGPVYTNLDVQPAAAQAQVIPHLNDAPRAMPDITGYGPDPRNQRAQDTPGSGFWQNIGNMISTFGVSSGPSATATIGDNDPMN